jgi:hypothetical protein
MNKAISRNNAIYDLLKKYNSNEDIKTKLSYGFIPDSIKDEFMNLYNEYLEKDKGKIDTDYDKSLFSSWFYINDNKILGEEKEGSGYINPVKTIGNVKDIDKIIPYNISSSTQKEKIKEMDSEKQPMKEKQKVSSSKELAILKAINVYENKKDEPIKDILTIEDSLKIYSPTISNAEIKGFVYFKQKFGSPMTGWEKWFLPTKGQKGKVCFANKSFYLKNQQFQDIKLVPTGSILGVKTKFKNEYSNDIFWVIKNESNELYYANEKDFTEENSFATTDENELKKLVLEKGLCFDGNDYVPVFMFTFGDIYDIKERFYGKYDRDTDKFEGGFKNDIIRIFGEESAAWHESLIENSLKSKYNFDFGNPIKSERPYLSKENNLSQTFFIKELNLDSGVSFKKHFDDLNRTKRRGSKIDYEEGETKFSIFDAFEIWFDYSVTDMMLEKTTVSDVKNLYFRGGNVFLSEESKSKEKKDQEKEKDERRILAKIEGDKFYSEFLATALMKNDLFALNLEFNKQFNNFVTIDLSKVPVAFEANNKIFNLDNFRLKPVQRNGLAFLSVNNSGCLAYDVGFGKTLTAIHNLAMLLKQGSVKRPLIAVPKQVYKNWIYEMFGYWTNGSERSTNKFKDSYFVNGALSGSKYKLNDWFNLGTGRGIENKEVPEYSITLVTYQGLEKIGFSEKLNQELSAEFYEILNVKEKIKTERQEEKAKEKSESVLGKALYKTEFDIDVLGFDYVVLDEAHAFKNVFTTFDVPEGYKDSWRLQKGSQSFRAIKTFTLCLYIQKKYNGNVNLLTATPFTNSPLELYSMLSLVGYNYLVNSKINNLFNFLSMFIETQVEYTVDHLQNIVLNTVIKSFKNKNILRDMLYRYFDYQDNPKDAGVKRPCKVNFPNKNVSTFLQMSDKQIIAQEYIQEEAESYDPKTNRGAIGRALSWAKSNSFSPFLVPKIEMYQDLDEFIEESPKIKYAIECIKSVKEYHENLGQECSGQVIYSNRGKDLFIDFKRALEQECGFKKGVKFGEDKVDEVEIITSSGNDADSDRKELIKDAFNDGYVKVIIGTATIQEGINLQKRGTVLYDLDLDWNPTSFKQLEGRIHRQGNKFKYVRIVVPLVQDTLDSFINQKLDEKSKRIASIWDKESQTNDYSVNDAIDPMELKFNLIKDERKLVAMKLDMNIEKTKKEYKINEEKNLSFNDLERAVESFKYYEEKVIPSVNKTVENFIEFLALIDRYMTERVSEDYQKLNSKKIEELKIKITETLDMYDDFKKNNNWKSLFEFKRAVNARRFDISIKKDEYDTFEISYSNLSKLYKNSWSFYSLNEFNNWSFDALLGAYGDAKRLEKLLLKPYGLTMFDDFTEIKGQYQTNFDASKNNLEYMKSEEYAKIILSEIREELEKRQGDIGSLEDRVEGFKRTNNLLTYPFIDDEADLCDIPTEVDRESEKYLKQELKQEEFLDFDDIDDEVLIKKKLKKIKDFMNKNQFNFVKNSEEYNEVINRVYKTIAEIPLIYQTESIKKDEKIAYLHYFTSSSDFYILELERGDIFDEDDKIQKEAFGYSILNGDYEMAELGYLSIDEIKKYAELDLYFEPTKLENVIEKYEDEEEKQVYKREYYIDAIAGLEVMLEYIDESERQMYLDAIDELSTTMQYL